MSAGSEAAGARSRAGLGHWLTAQRGVLLAVAIFAAMFALYGWKQPVGLTASVINTAANKGVLLALIAMAAIGVYMALGGSLRNLVSAETQKLQTGSDQTVEQVDTPGQSSGGSSINTF